MQQRVESARKLWQDASPLKRALIAGVPAVIIALVAVGAVFAGFSAASDDGEEQVAAPTTPTATATTDPWKLLAYLQAISPPTPTPTPGVNAGLQNDGSSGSSGGGGGGGAQRRAAPGPALTGPGPALGTDMRLSIPSLGVNATVYSRTVGTSGQMGNPTGAWDVIWYDFSQNWVGLGGRPGEASANAVFAGHVDYIRVGPAVFWGVRNLKAGDMVTVNTSAGPVNYQVQWAVWAGPSDDFTQHVRSGGPDSITLVTCIGGFSAGHYSNRLVVRGVRV